MKSYRVSNKPQHTASNQGSVFGGAVQSDVDVFNARLRADRIHKSRSDGQKRRQARERLYGKQSHLVTVRRIEGWEPR